jgi:abequosyltransferase
MTQTAVLSRPLLTIAIPTFNRADCLRGSLATLLPQLRDRRNVELIISDNASSDDTPVLVRGFQQRGLNLRYMRNEINRGLDANLLQCFEQATGKYLWILGDDDVVLPDSLAKILSMLAETDYSLVYLCVYPFSRDYVAERRHDRYRRFAQVVPNGLPFIRSVGIMITFISSIIVNRDRCQSASESALRRFVGCFLIHLAWLLPVLESGGENLIVWDRLIAGRHSYEGGWKICQVFGNNLMELLGAALPGRKDFAAAIINPALKSWFPFMILQVRNPSTGLVGQEDFHKSLSPLYGRNWRYWLYVFPVAVWPCWAARIWYFGSLQLERAERLIGLVITYPLWRKNLIRESKITRRVQVSVSG